MLILKLSNPIFVKQYMFANHSHVHINIEQHDTLHIYVFTYPMNKHINIKQTDTLNTYMLTNRKHARVNITQHYIYTHIRLRIIEMHI